MAKKQVFEILKPGLNVIKLCTDIIYECLQKARVFVPGRPFQPSLMFVVKAGAYLSEAPLRCSILSRLLALPTNID